MFDRANALPTMTVIRQMRVAIASFRFRVMGELLLSELREVAWIFGTNLPSEKPPQVIAVFFGRQLRKIASETVKRATVTCHHRTKLFRSTMTGQSTRA